MYKDYNRKTVQTKILDREIRLTSSSETVYTDVFDQSEFSQQAVLMIVTNRTGTGNMTISRMIQDAFGTWFDYSSNFFSGPTVVTQYQHDNLPHGKNMKYKITLNGSIGDGIDNLKLILVRKS